MADHDELVAEMTILEQMGTQERQKLAKKRRMQQLKKWAQREKEWITKERQLNKRLANILHEENNGLNLKQYTQYGSAQRSNAKTKKSSDNVDSKNSNNKPQQGAKVNSHGTKDIKTIINANNNNSINNNNTTSSNNNSNNNNNNNPTKNDNSLVICRKEPESLSPNGRVHFNVGVMLLEAAARNDFEEVKRLLSLGVSPDSINHDGLTALHQCCIDASERMMILLLEYGANVDARDTEQWTPLHAACTCGHLNLVKILVEHGADLLAVNGDGNMPFDVCEDETTLDYIESQMVARGITQEMIDLARASTEMQMINDLEKLVAANAGNRDSVSALKESLDEPINEDGVTRLHVAAANGYISVIKFLLKHGANVNCCDNDLWRPLHGAACWGNDQHCKVIEMLVEAGADLYAKTTNDETVFDLCDNVELLDKLNQLKDELESRKAATGPDDRLRRTQSRTNSRVHSVRRTSVRDKNQISRREAREEALLRVESNEKVSLTTNEVANSSTESEPTDRANESHKKASKSDSNELQKQQRKQETDLDVLEVLDQAPEKPVEVTASDGGSMDVVDSVSPRDDINPRLNGARTKSQSDTQWSSEKPVLKIQDTTVGQSNRSQLDPDTKTITREDIIINSTTNESLPKSASNSTHLNGLNSKTAGVSVSTGDKQSMISNRQISNSKLSVQVAYKNPMQANESSTISNNYLRSNDGNNNNRHKANNSGEDNNIAPTNCDVLTTKQQHPQQHIVATQLIPVNYTLSNLKKHRSDLRMRASSQCLNSSNSVATMNHLSMTDAKTLGGSSSFAISTIPSSTVLTDEFMQPSLNPGGDSATTTIPVNGQANNERDHHNDTTNSRTESPSMTFRKFHGEPSEVIDIGRASRRKCCILM